MQSGLKRSRTDVILGGVAGGIAKALNIDPVLPRLIFIVLTIAGGGGLLIYIILWIAVPQEEYMFNPYQSQASTPEPEVNTEEPKEPSPFQPEPPRKKNGNLLAGVILITIGVIFLVHRFINWLDFGHLWPILLVIAGVVLLANALIKKS
jgi:phage shock protein C